MLLLHLMEEAAAWNVARLERVLAAVVALPWALLLCAAPWASSTVPRLAPAVQSTQAVRLPVDVPDRLLVQLCVSSLKSPQEAG